MNLTPYTRIELARYAMDENKSKGRKKDIEDKFELPDFRTQFQRDRDRIIHAKAFRRLESKTQVAISHESDHNRKRLTHSLEVWQISETIAYNLGLNIFLTQAIALGHDLGHTPFGHGGEEILDEILKDFNRDGFKHNYQSLLVINKLERKYEDGLALNLMWETRDGILKHTGLRPDIDLKYYDDELEKEPYFPLTLEGQVVRLVDEIAQRTHDTDDGIRSGRMSFRELLEQPFIIEILEFAGKYGREELRDLFEINDEEATFYLIRSMIKFYVADLLRNTRKTVFEENIETFDDVIGCRERPIVSFSKGFEQKDEDFKVNFLRPNFYDHYEIKRMDSRGKYFLKQIFLAFKENPKQLPKWVFEQYINEIKNDLKKRMERGDLHKSAKTIFDSDEIPCEKRCTYVPTSKEYKLRPSDLKQAFDHYGCPIQSKALKGQGACEGVRVIINHIAGMSDRFANLEYARLYLPPEISRI